MEGPNPEKCHGVDCAKNRSRINLGNLNNGSRLGNGLTWYRGRRQYDGPKGIEQGYVVVTCTVAGVGGQDQMTAGHMVEFKYIIGRYLS